MQRFSPEKTTRERLPEPKKTLLASKAERSAPLSATKWIEPAWNYQIGWNHELRVNDFRPNG